MFNIFAANKKNTAPARLNKPKKIEGKGITKAAYKKALTASRRLKRAGKSSVVDIEGTNFVVFCNGIIYEKTGKKAGKASLPYKPLANERQFVDFKKVMKKVRNKKKCVKSKQAGGHGGHKRISRTERSKLDKRYVRVLMEHVVDKHIKKHKNIDVKDDKHVEAVLKSMEQAMKLDFAKHNKDLLYRRHAKDRSAIRSNKYAILKKDIWGYNDGKNAPRPRTSLPALPSKTVVRNCIKKCLKKLN